jgi:hypothetical protein
MGEFTPIDEADLRADETSRDAHRDPDHGSHLPFTAVLDDRDGAHSLAHDYMRFPGERVRADAIRIPSGAFPFSEAMANGGL